MTSSHDPAAAWARSGAMMLTGPHEAPMMAPGDPAGFVRRALATLRQSTGARTGAFPELPGTYLLSERAFHARLRRQAPFSCGGKSRALKTEDGWFALTLARSEDMDLVPALTEGQAAGVPDPWPQLESWARSAASAEVHERCLALGLPGRPIRRDAAAGRPGIVKSPGGVRTMPHAPLVIDLSSLWAGPLASHLLQLAGCRVIKLEGRHRPDGARRGSTDFYDLLNAGKGAMSVDLADAEQLDLLKTLLTRADVVIDSSRPEALARRGIEASTLVESGTSWVSITAEGRASRSVGFGDDVAMGAGLVVDLNLPAPCGDAIADPLTGVATAAAACEALLDDRAQLIDVSMIDVCHEALGDGSVPEHNVHLSGERGWVETSTGLHPILGPHGRLAPSPAPQLGQDDHLWGEAEMPC